MIIEPIYAIPHESVSGLVKPFLIGYKGILSDGRYAHGKTRMAVIVRLLHNVQTRKLKVKSIK